MNRIVLCLGAAAAVVWGGLAVLGLRPAETQADTTVAEPLDPAVAVCQWDLLRGPSSADFKLMNATIEGMRVTLTYERAPLGTKPKVSTHTCDFEMGVGEYSGKIHFAMHELVEKCSPQAERFMQAQASLSRSELILARRRLGMCVSLAMESPEERARLLQTVAERETPLERLGLYPIDPADTALHGPEAKKGQPTAD